MVHLYCEDNKGGYHLVNLLNKIYFDGKFVVENLNGIYKLGRKIEDIIRKMGEGDKAIIIYDDSPGNGDVKNELEIAYKKIDGIKADDIYFIPIICMEYEVLSTYGIKTFANRRIHSVIDDLSGYRDKTNVLKNHLKADIRYKVYRDRVVTKVQRSYASRCRKLHIGVSLTERGLNKRITVDRICKEIMAEGFQNELIIDKADRVGRCWLDTCCIKRNKICNISDKKIVGDRIEGCDKQKFLMHFSRYHKVAIKISEISGVDIREISDADIEKMMRFINIDV